MITMKKIAVLAILTGSASCVSNAMAQDVDGGRHAYEQCIACHASNASNGVGPGLHGIVGRASASTPGFRYSPAMKRAKLTWDDKTLDAYLQNPQTVVPGNLMPFSGVEDSKQRADLIAYLKTFK
jgi:cytochrome c